MNPTQLHLALNHFPIVGLLFGTGLLLYAIIRQNETLQRTAAVFFIICAIFLLPVYFSGEDAEHLVEEKVENVSHDLIHEHEEIAEVALILTLLLGVSSIVLLYIKEPKRAYWIALLVFAIVSNLMLFNTAFHGAQIRHTEVYGEHQSH